MNRDTDGCSFADCAVTAFGWLEGDHGAFVADRADEFVEYRSATACFLVAIVGGSDPAVRFLDTAIYQCSDGSSAMYSIDFVVKLRDTELSDASIRRRFGIGRFPANTVDEMRDSLARLSSLWRDALRDLDLSDPELWRSLAAEGDLRVMQLADDNAAGQARAAFDAGDYRAAVALYERVPAALGSTDAKRLEIARRRLGQGA